VRPSARARLEDLLHSPWLLQQAWQYAAASGATAALGDLPPPAAPAIMPVAAAGLGAEPLLGPGIAGCSVPARQQAARPVTQQQHPAYQHHQRDARPEGGLMAACRRLFSQK
jgi:hypothetical protein